MKKYFLFNVWVIIFASLLVSCSSHDSSKETDSHHSSHAGHSHEGEIVISNEDAADFGIVVEQTYPQPFNSVIKVTGQITANSSDEFVVSAPIAGMLTLNSIVATGAEVKAGLPIGSVSVNNVSGGNPNESAKVAVEAAKKELERLEPLLKEGIVTQKEYNLALANYQSAKSMYSPQASGGLSSPISGVISEVYVKSGVYVSVGTPIVKISKNVSLMLLADLPEKYKSFLPDVVSANIRLPYTDEWVSIDSLDSNKMTFGAGENISRTGYIPVLFSISNDGRFSSGSYVDVCLVCQSNKETLSVPNGAIIEQQGNYFVFVKTGGHSYKKHKVELGDSNGFKTQILSGVKPGSNVVVKGAMMVLLSEQSGKIPHGHSHNH